MKTKNTLFSILLLAPTATILMAWMGYPLLYSFWSSFYKIDVTASIPPRFVGLGNYLKFLTSARSSQFYQSLKITLLYTGVVTCFQLVLGFSLAVLLYPTRLKRWIMPIFVSPMLIAPVAVAVVWKILYDLDYGIFNYFLIYLGLQPVLWLGNPPIALSSLMLTEIWQNTSFVLLVLSAGLASLPIEPYEAAKIDGASRYAMFRYITLPLLKPAILVVLLIRTMLSFRVFDHVYILTQGGPGRVTTVLGYWAYELAFKFWHIGEAAALSYIMIGITGSICIIYMRVMRRQTEHKNHESHLMSLNGTR